MSEPTMSLEQLQAAVAAMKKKQRPNRSMAQSLERMADSLDSIAGSLSDIAHAMTAINNRDSVARPL